MVNVGQKFNAGSRVSVGVSVGSIQSCKGGGNHLEQERIRQKAMEGIDGGLHPAVDGHSVGER